MTQEMVGGAGVERSETESYGMVFPSSAPALFPRSDFPETEFDDAPECFAEDAAGHLGGSQLAVRENDRHFLDPESQPVRRILHFDLETVSFHLDGIQVDRFEDSPRVADEAGRGVIDLHVQDGTHVRRCVVGHDDPAHRPVHDADAVTVAGADGEVRALFRAGGIQAEKVVRVVGEIGIHLEDVVVSVVQGPAETCQIGRSKALLAAPFEQMQPFGEFGLKSLDDAGRPVG